MTADSYYGRPIVKEPVWKPQVAFYLFTGGIAGGSAVLHGLAKLASATPASSAAPAPAAARHIEPRSRVVETGSGGRP